MNTAAAPTTTANRKRKGGAAALQAQLEGLHHSLQRLFAQRRQAHTRRRGQLHRQLMLGLELMWKIEDQVVLPALHEALGGRDADVQAADGPEGDAGAFTVGQVMAELNLMRDQALLAGQTSGNNRDLALGVLEGMAMLHFARVARLVTQAPAHGADWAALDREVSGLLGRWRSEVQAHSEVEDEDRDPVGLPPR